MRNKLVLLLSLLRSEALAGDKQEGGEVIGVGEEYQRRVKEAISISNPRQSWAVPWQFPDSQGHTNYFRGQRLAASPPGPDLTSLAK